MRSNRTIRYFSTSIDKLPQVDLKEKDILMCRLKEISLREIGKKYSVTEGRIRQIEKIAIKKIKNKIYQQKLFKA